MGFGIRLYHGPERFTGAEISEAVAKWIATQIPGACAGTVEDDLLGAVPTLYLPAASIGIWGRRVKERQRSRQEAIALLERHRDWYALIVWSYPDIWFACHNVQGLRVRMIRDRLDALLIRRQDQELASTHLTRIYLRDLARWLADAIGPTQTSLPKWDNPPQKGGGSGGAS